MSEQEPQLTRIQVEVSEFADEWYNAWEGVWASQRLFDMANAAMRLSGVRVQLDPIYRGRDMQTPEVIGLLDDEGIAHNPRDEPEKWDETPEGGDK